MAYKSSNYGEFALKIFIGVCVIASIIVIWFAREIFLLIFAGCLLAVFLRGASRLLRRLINFPESFCLFIVLLLLIGLIVGFFWLLGPNLASKFNVLSRNLISSAQKLINELKQYDLGRKILSEASSSISSGPNLGMLSRISDLFSSTIAVLVNAFIIIFVGLYLSFEPHIYLNGLIRLVPIPQRDRAREILNAIGHTLRWWLVGRFTSMILIGLFTTIGLSILGIPLALTLGLLAGLLTFIPYLGTIISAIPALLIALTVSPHMIYYVTFLYLGVHAVEGYVISPLIQLKAISLPPALTVIAQLLLGIVSGGLGLILATPLIAMIIVLVQAIYIENILGDEIELLG